MRRKTHEEFINQISKINENIEILSKYKKDNIKIDCKCKICGFEWSSTPSNLLMGKGCKKCHFEKLHNLKLKSNEVFLNEMYSINKDIKILDKYNGRYKKINCKCLIHDTIFSITPSNLLCGQTGCKECIKLKNHLSGLKSHDDFVNELYNINKSIKVIGEYTGAKNKIEVKCLKCGNTWSPEASSLLSGYGCGNCRKSKGEEKIEGYLINNNIKYKKQKKFKDLKNKLPLSYDFYLSEYNILIEYQGQFHDGTAIPNHRDEYFERQKYNDELKRNYALSNNYNLLEIWYYDFDNIDEILNNYIYNLKNPVTTTV